MHPNRRRALFSCVVAFSTWENLERTRVGGVFEVQRHFWTWYGNGKDHAETI